MTNRADGSQAKRRGTVDNPVDKSVDNCGKLGDSMTRLVSIGEVDTAGFEKVPTALTLDKNLTLGARAAYPLLLHMAYLAGRRNDGDAVCLPSIIDMATSFGVTQTTLGKYITELKASGWITVKAASRTRPRLYTVNTSLENREIRTVEKSRKSRAPRVRAILARSSSKDTLASQARAEMPIAMQIDGQFLPYNALVRVTGADPDAESGKIGAGLRKIRALYWRDLPDEVKAVMDRESFERGLAAEIEARAQLYEIRYRGEVELTPTALASNWVRVTKQQPRRMSELEQWSRDMATKEGS